MTIQAFLNNGVVGSNVHVHTQKSQYYGSMLNSAHVLSLLKLTSSSFSEIKTLFKKDSI